MTSIDRYGNELSERSLVSLRARYGIPSSVVMRRPKAIERANAPPPGLRSIFVVALEMACVFLSTLMWETCEGLRIGVPTGFTCHPKSKGAYPRSTKHKADSIAFSTYLANTRPMPPHFYSDPWVLKAAGLSTSSDAHLGALEVLRATFNGHDHPPPPPLAAHATSSDQQPLLLAPTVARPVVVSSSLEEDEVMGPLLRRYLPFPGLTTFVDPFVSSILTWVAFFRDGTSESSMESLSASMVPPSGQGLGNLPLIDSTSTATPVLAGEYSVTVVLELEDPREVISVTPHDASTSSSPILAPQVAGLSPSPPEGLPSFRKRVRSPLANPPPTQSQRRSDKTPLSQVRILSS
ncbi:hypothetical protein LIER_19229 [Lithospermum erythrorhizon]|uniref:Uncharacterized protein n=1 Tax=Lithospermum erythrorhizon TaxID=34254 RepID=A0AAV3QIG6_LITER